VNADTGRNTVAFKEKAESGKNFATQIKKKLEQKQNLTSAEDSMNEKEKFVAKRLEKVGLVYHENAMYCTPVFELFGDPPLMIHLTNRTIFIRTNLDIETPKQHGSQYPNRVSVSEQKL
jgi:hypothetical protein